MAKRTGFNLSQSIRDYQKSHPKATANEALAAVKANHPKLNESTFRATFYKLKSGGKRTVRRKKPGRGGSEGAGVLPAAVAFIRAAGGLAAAKEVLAELEAFKEL